MGSPAIKTALKIFSAFSLVAFAGVALLLMRDKQESQQELVPKYLAQLPPAKWGAVFTYEGDSQRHVLGWTEIPPVGRPFYVLEEKRWGYLD